MTSGCVLPNGNKIYLPSLAISCNSLEMDWNISLMQSSSPGGENWSSSENKSKQDNENYIHDHKNHEK